MNKRYRQSEGKHCIEVRVKSHLQLFDVRDPAPFRERDLDDNFVDYIMASARDFSVSTPLKIVIHIDESDATKLSKESIYEAIKNFFSYELDGQRSELKSYVKRAQTFFLIGLGILGSCLGIAQNITVSNPPGTMGIIREGIIIFGWVSIWKPIELVLFDWYPLFEKIRLYKKLFATEIEIQFISVDAATTSPPGRAIEF